MRFLSIFIAIVFVVAIVMAGSFAWDAFIISAPEDAETIAFEIDDGASVSQIAASLKEQGFIDSDFFFKVFVKLMKAQGSLQAGDFELRQGMSYRQIVKELRHALAIEVELTIPEGYTLKQIGETVVKIMPLIGETDWSEVTGIKGKLMLSSRDVLAGVPSGQDLEGYLFPDTYRFREEANAAVVAETMVITLKRRMSEKGIVIPESLQFDNSMSLHEVLTLASVIQREVRDPEDMKQVAGIFFTRMKIGMALQADSTVNYVTGKNDPGVSIVDTKIDSPYNTYRNLGLPPGPISNPGIDAIMAVLDPTDSEYLYFLTSPKGEVIYSKTFNEHIDNKNWYLK